MVLFLSYLFLITAGMLISIFCESHTMANFVSTGAFYPMIVLCGLLWPLEGMPQFLRNFSLLLPFTIPTISVNLILFLLLSFQPVSNDIRTENKMLTNNANGFSGAEYFNQRNADHQSKRVQWLHSYILVDCGILLFMFGWLTAKEVKFISYVYSSVRRRKLDFG